MMLDLAWADLDGWRLALLLTDFKRFNYPLRVSRSGSE